MQGLKPHSLFQRILDFVTSPEILMMPGGDRSFSQTY